MFCALIVILDYVCGVGVKKMPKYCRTLTFCQKVCLIEEAEKWTSSKTQLAEKHKVPLSTLSTTLKNKTKI